MSTKLLIAADVVPVKTNIDFIRQGNALSLFGKDMYERLTTADFIVVNLDVKRN